jgi:hypothetical protein
MRATPCLTALLAIVALLGPVGPARAEGQKERATNGAGLSPRAFGDPQPFLSRFARRRGLTGATFCVVGYDSPRTKYPFAEVYWKEADTMTLWKGAELQLSRRVLSHARDVVATEADVGSSTYLVSEPWWARTKRDCARFGDTFVLRARSRWLPTHPRSS